MDNNKNAKPVSDRWLIAAAVFLILLLIYSLGRLIFVFVDYNRSSSEYEALSEAVVVTTETLPSIPVETSYLEISNDTLPTVVTSYSVDLEAMKEINPDTIGWIILPDSKINYPIVSSKDNEEYLNTTFEGKKSSSGAIFTDKLCGRDFDRDNTIIYGHNMKNGSMFRDLNNMTSREFFNSHRVFHIDTGNGFELYEIISCYETKDSDSSPLTISFDTAENYESWLRSITKRCTYDCADYDVNKKTITLSTCRGRTGGSGRFIVHLQKITD